MKINFICHNLSGRGGVETVLVKVVNYLSHFYDISIILINIPQDERWLKKVSKKVNIVFPKHEGKVYILIYLLKFFLLADKDEKMIVLGVNLVRLAKTFKRILLKRYIVFSWIHFSLVNQNMFDPHNLLGADYHLAISSAIKQQMIDLGIPREKIFLILNPISRHTLVPTQLSNKRVRNLNLLYVGRTLFHGQKNLKELLDNLACLEPTSTLDVFGSSTKDEVNKCRNYAIHLGLKNQIMWHGWNDRPWDDITSMPFALVMTSTFEGLPMAMLEAMSRGIPVITTRFEGYDSVLKEGVNGYSYQIGDIQGFKDAVTKLQTRKLPPKQVSDSIDEFYSDNYFKKLIYVLNNC